MTISKEFWISLYDEFVEIHDGMEVSMQEIYDYYELNYIPDRGEP